MDAKKELTMRLWKIVPEQADRIVTILEEYEITRTSERRELDRCVEAFLTAKRLDGLSQKTLRDYGGVLRAFSACTDKPAGQITADDIRLYIGGLARRGLRESSIQTHVSTLRSFFSWLAAEDTIGKSPMCRIRTRKLDRTATRHPLTDKELTRLREHCRDCRERALVEFLATSGCRLSEAAGIRLEQIDWQRRSVRVLGKGHKERTVFFSAEAGKLLEAYTGSRGGGASLFATARPEHRPLSPRSIQRIIREIGQRAGLARRVHPHILRHTFATQALKGGMALPVIQQLLGHEDPKTTMIYAAILPEAARRAYTKIFDRKEQDHE